MLISWLVIIYMTTVFGTIIFKPQFLFQGWNYGNKLLVKKLIKHAVEVILRITFGQLLKI